MAALAGLAGGCSADKAAEGKASLTPEETAVATAAPAEWSAFLAWCEKELSVTPAAVPLPTNPNLPAPKWPITRLLDSFSSAKVSATWEPEQHPIAPLTEVGPFRSDAPNANFQFVKSFQKRYGDSLDFVVRGLNVNRDQVGAITLTIRAPFGKFVDLIWSAAGSVRVPIPDNEKFWTLTVATDGLVEWTGVLKDLQLHMDGTGDGLVEIKSIEFMPREELYPKPVDLCRTTINHVRRTAAYLHAPATLTFENVKVPENGKLSFNINSVLPSHLAGGATPAADGGEPTFEVVIRDGDSDRTVSTFRPEKPNDWSSHSVSLADWGGKNVSLTLRMTGGAANRVGLWATPTVYQPVENPPIYVLYLVDTLAARRMSLYGYERPTTPRIDALAQRGVWFANMRTQAPVTVASLPHMMLSMPTERHGVSMASIGIPPALVTMAETFQAAGYATASFVTSEYAGPRQNMDQGFDYFDDRVSLFWLEPRADRTVPIDDVMEWMKRRSDRPMFVYIHTAEPHAPYLPPEGFRGKFDPDYTGAVDGTIDRERGIFSAKTPRDIEHVRALYDEEVLYADHRFGEFEDALKEAGLLDRANLFLIADHGEELFEHGVWGHGPNLHRETMRIPFVAAGPAITGRGRQDVPSCMYDVLPTLLDLSGLPQPYPLSGMSLAEALHPDGPFAPLPPADRTLIIAHYQGSGFGILDYSVLEALRWKLILSVSGKDAKSRQVKYELFDMASDPHEQKNLLDQNRDIARRLLVKLVAYHRQQHPYVSAGGALQYDPKQLRDLKSMGYVGE